MKYKRKSGPLTNNIVPLSYGRKAIFEAWYQQEQLENMITQSNNAPEVKIGACIGEITIYDRDYRPSAVQLNADDIINLYAAIREVQQTPYVFERLRFTIGGGPTNTP